MSYINSYHHFVWSTKHWAPYLKSPELRKTVWQHIWQEGRKKGIHIDVVSGYEDHCHCLISVGASQSLQDIAHLLKGESSFWINKEKLCPTRFSWQHEYFAAAVSQSIVPRVRQYILNQEIHHQRRSSKDEYAELMKKHGFDLPKT